MDFNFTAEQTEFRSTVHDFIENNWVKGAWAARSERWKAARAYESSLADGGWLTMSWPEDYGGGGATYWEQMIFNEESALASAPSGGQGADRVGPVLIIHGTDAQKQEHLPPIAQGEVMWCQGYSEPGSGSDLASLQTRATRDGDDFIINGQKIWTSGAMEADWVHILTRTDAEAPKHRGISYFMLKLDTPGITIRPISQLHDEGDGDGHGFNETFFEDVRVPSKNMIGEENRGWYVAATALDFERSGIHRMAGAISPYYRLLENAKQANSGGNGRKISDHNSSRQALADTRIEIEVARYLGYRVTWMQASNLVPNQESSMSKMFGSELQQRTARRGISMLGLYGGLRPTDSHAPLNGEFCQYYMTTVSLTIAAGTSEIQRNIIATRGLGLPRG